MIRKSILKLFSWVIISIGVAGCMPFDKIVSHDFNSGFFKLKTPESNPENVYLNLMDDSIVVYPFTGEGKLIRPDINTFHGINISSIKSGSYLYNSTFVKTSVDIDLSTALLKFRPAMADVAPQLSANLNGIFYTGFRKDFYRIKSHISQISAVNTFVRHTGFDFGIFAGIGITPVNSTVTMNRTTQEYDGIVFQKGFSIFATYESMSIGLALGFDNLLDNNKNIWIYNQKPWIGLVLGIANF
jgi:hypothetical protein